MTGHPWKPFVTTDWKEVVQLLRRTKEYRLLVSSSRNSVLHPALVASSKSLYIGQRVRLRRRRRNFQTHKIQQKADEIRHFEEQHCLGGAHADRKSIGSQLRA